MLKGDLLKVLFMDKKNAIHCSSGIDLDRLTLASL